MSNFLTSAFDSVRRSALDAARMALPQRCELCAGVSGTALVCGACMRDLPWLPRACPVCALPSGGSVCGHCLSDPPAFDATIAAFLYAFPIDRLIHSLKYQGRLALAEWCADAILARRELANSGVSSRPDRLIALPLAVLRDDVMTTGASLAEAAKVLKASGAVSVENWVVARTLPPAL